MNDGWDRKRFAGHLSGTTFLALAGMLWLVPALPAQDTGQPTRAVRLSYVYGNVTLAQNGEVLASQAVANTPLFQGMSLATDKAGRAEIQFEDGSVARLAPDSKLTLQVLRGEGSTGDAELVLNRGLAYFELQDDPQIGKMTVHFGNSVVTASGFTILRIRMDNPPSHLAVFSGNAHLERDNGAMALDMHGGESVALAVGDPSGYTLAESIPSDSWDAWNSDRDQALTTEAADQTQAPQNLGDNSNPNNPAWGELDAYGTWYDIPDQGYVWSPYDAANAGFDPYANGNWMWMPGFGYIWASAYSWGYLPFQCGAWNFYTGFGWGWAPGFGGCRPWWVGGFYRGPNIGLAPPGYRRIRLPHRPPPRHPIGRIPHRMIAVHRPPTVITAGLPSRRRSAPVFIRGRMVRALGPLPSRPVAAHGFPGVENRRVLGPFNRPTTGVRNAFTGNRLGYTPTLHMPRPVYVQPHRATPNRGLGFPHRGFAAPNQGQFGSRSPARPIGPPVGMRGFHGAGGGGGGFHGGRGSGRR